MTIVATEYDIDTSEPMTLYDVTRMSQAFDLAKFRVPKRVLFPSSLSGEHRLFRFRGTDAPYRLVVALLIAFVGTNRDSSNSPSSGRRERRRNAVIYYRRPSDVSAGLFPSGDSKREFHKRPDLSPPASFAHVRVNVRECLRIEDYGARERIRLNKRSLPHKEYLGEKRQFENRE